MYEMQKAEKKGATSIANRALGTFTDLCLQCDEVRPICSRCEKRNYCCRYSGQGSRLKPESSEDLDGSYSALETLDAGYLSHLSTSPSSSEIFPHSISSSQSGIVSVTGHPASIPSQSSLTPRTLNSRELELLSHYIMHTSRAIPIGEEDLYVLNVVIPNLAFGSESVMASMLALSAACRCRDILDQSESPETLEEISELFHLADKHHQMSLRQTQAAIHNVDHVDSVLANAALMVLYALANHSVRVSLAAKGEREGKPLPSEMLPLQSQWLTLIRAAYTAYVGLLHGLPDEPSMVPPSWVSRTDVPEIPPFSIYEIHIPQDGPSPSTKKLLMPIVSATYKAALQNLDARVRSVVTGDVDAVASAGIVGHSGLGECVTSLTLLEDIFTDTFAEKPSVSEDLDPQSETAISDHLQTGRLQKASPWLARYLARVTSARPSKLLRRSITAFLNHVPREYLQLVNPYWTAYHQR